MNMTTTQAPEFLGNAPEKTMPVDSSKVIEIFEKLFKGKVLIRHSKKAGFTLFVAPYDVEANSIEEEVIRYYFQDAVINNYLISIPFKAAV